VKRFFKSFDIILYVLVFGVIGALLRAVELAIYIDPITNLYEAPGLFAFALPGVTVLAAALCVWYGLKYRDKQGAGFTKTYGVDHKFTKYLLLASAVMLILAGAFKMISVAMAFADTLSYFHMVGMPDLVTMVRELSIAQLVYGLITCITGFIFLSLTKTRSRKQQTESTRFLATIPIFWACFMVIFTFMEHPVEPVIQIFAYDLLGAAAIVLAVYNTAAILFGKAKLFKPVVSSLLSLYLIAVTVGGRALAFVLTGRFHFLTDSPFRMVVFAAMFLYSIVNVCSIIKSEQN